MARLERPQQKSSNPATKFLSWKSNDKSFEYFDKEKAEKVNVSLPFKFLFFSSCYSFLFYMGNVLVQSLFDIFP